MKFSILPLLGLFLWDVHQISGQRLPAGSGSGFELGSGFSDLETPRKATTRVVPSTSRPTTTTTTTTIAPKRIVPVTATTVKPSRPTSPILTNTSPARTIIISDDEDEDDVLNSSGFNNFPRSNIGKTDDTLFSGSGDITTSRITTARSSITSSTSRPTTTSTTVTPTTATTRSSTTTQKPITEETITAKKAVQLGGQPSTSTALKPRTTASTQPDVVVNEAITPKYEKPAVAEDPDGKASGKDGQMGVAETEREPIKPEGALFSHPGILAAVIGGGVVALLSALLLIMFIVYRMRKKDEGSYPLDDSKPRLNIYTRAPNKEFYA